MNRVRAGSLVAALVAVVPAGCTFEAVPPGVDAGERRKPVWSVDVPSDLGRLRLGQVAGDAVVVQGDNGVLVLARSDGAVRWRRVAPAAATSEVVAVTGTTMVVRYGTYLALVDLATGTERGTVRSPSLAARVTPTGVYVADSVGSNRPVVAYDLAGNRRWQHDFAGDVDLTTRADVGFSTPFAPMPDGRPLLATVRQGTDDPWEVVSLSPDTGAEITRFGGPDGFGPFRTPRMRQVAGSLLVWDDETTTDCHTSAAAFDAGTGTRTWSATVGLHDLWPILRDRECTSRWTPRVAADRILTTGATGSLQMLDPVTGTQSWPGPIFTYPLTATADTLLGREKKATGDLVAFDTATGGERWRLALPDGNDHPTSTVNRESAATGDTFVVTIQTATTDLSNGARVTVIDARTGKVRWSAPVGGNLLGASADGVVTWTNDLLDDTAPKKINYFD